MRFSRASSIALTTVSLLALLSATHGSPSEGSKGRKPSQNGGQKNGGKQAGQNGNTQSGKDIEKFKADLKRIGPESRSVRESAVESLFGIDDLRAHAVLQEYVTPGPDPDRVRRLILGRLPSRLDNPLDPVFSAKNNKRDVIRRSYVGPLVQHFTGGPFDDQARELRGLARRSLIAMETANLSQALEVLVGVKSQATREQALRAAGQSQKVTLASLIARFLGDERLGAVAQTALFHLTYVEFKSRAVFDTWIKANAERSYTDLAEDAARQARSKIADAVDSVQTKLIATLIDHIDVLATSKLEDRWKRIHAHVFPTSGVSVDVMQACLDKLAKALGPPAPPVTPGPGTPDRLAFYQELSKRLGNHPTPKNHALLLEVASYVCAATETGPRAEQLARLIDGLKSKSDEVRLGSLRGLRVFFSAITRDAVVDVAVRARSERQNKILEVAVQTLKTRGWWAPLPDDKNLMAWVDGLHAILADDSLPVPLRKDVLDVLCTPTSDKLKRVPRVFGLLLEELARETAPVELRLTLMLRLPSFLPAPGAERDAAAARLLASLEALQADKVTVDVRREAANLLVVPEDVSKEKADELGTGLVRHIGARLLKEKDEAVFRKLVQVLKDHGANDSLESVVNRFLKDALAALGGKGESQKLARHVVEGLKLVARKEGQATAEWAATCVALLKQQERKAVQQILAFQFLTRTPDLKNEKLPELKHQVWELVLSNAALAPAEIEWSIAENLDEAGWVIAAFHGLNEAKLFTKDLDTAKTRLTYLRCLDAVGKREAALIQQAQQWLAPGDTLLTGPERDEARLLLAKALHDSGKTWEAWTTTGMQQVQGAMKQRRLDFQNVVARTLIQKSQKPRAKILLKNLVDETKRDDPRFWPRFRQYLMLRHNLKEKSAQLLEELDTWEKEVTSKLSPEVQRQILECKATLQGSASPGRQQK